MPAILRKFVQPVLVALVMGLMFAAPADAQDDAQSAEQAQTAPSDIEKRLRRIEDNLTDMRGMIGALQSFAPGDGTAPAQGTAPTQGDARAPDGASRETDTWGDPLLDGDGSPTPSEPRQSADRSPELQQLELQLQALSSQLSETIKRLDRLESAVDLAANASAPDAAPVQPSSNADDREMRDREPGTEAEAETDSVAKAAPDTQTGFGTTTVETQSSFGPEENVTGDAAEQDSARADEVAGAPPEARILLRQAYDALEAEEYASARQGFEVFLDKYPDNPMTNKVRYALADTAFAQGDYVTAANNFVKFYNATPRGEKSEEALLNLAIVLRRLDRPESACDALSRLDGRLESMPESFRERVNGERSRSGCG